MVSPGLSIIASQFPFIQAHCYVILLIAEFKICLSNPIMSLWLRIVKKIRRAFKTFLVGIVSNLLVT